MARRRRSRRGYYARHERGIGGLLTGGSFFVTFLSQLTAKDIAANQSAFNGYNISQKAQFLANTVLGRITGINIFNNVPQVPQTINPAGMVNKYTGLGLLGLGYVWAGKYFKLPFRGPVKAIASGSLGGGLAGGLFDAPDNANTSTNQSYASQASFMSAPKSTAKDILS